MDKKKVFQYSFNFIDFFSSVFYFIKIFLVKMKKIEIA